MANKVDEAILKRLLYLHSQGLTQSVIGQRLGISSRTVRYYLAESRKDQDVCTESSPAQAEQAS
jgi:DNA-binding transcriptional regulator LsrR (DeoR family)